MQKQAIKTLAEAEEMLKETPALYLISFVTEDGRPGSTVIGMKEDVPLYKPYFIFNEVNKDKQMLTILGITKLAGMDDDFQTTNVINVEAPRKEDDLLHDVSARLLEQESAALNREMTEFLQRHNLPLDRKAIADAGFVVVTEARLPADMLDGKTMYVFKLAKVVDQVQVAIKHDIKAI
mgnify:CR=1 FL=1